MTSKLPDEIWIQIALTDPRVYSVLVRTMSCISRNIKAKAVFAASSIVRLRCVTGDEYECELPTVGGLIHTNGTHYALEDKAGNVLRLDASYGKLTGGTFDRSSFGFSYNGNVVAIHAEKGRLVGRGKSASVTINNQHINSVYIYARNNEITAIKYAKWSDTSLNITAKIISRPYRVRRLLRGHLWSKNEVKLGPDTDRLVDLIIASCVCAEECLTDVTRITAAIDKLMCIWKAVIEH